MPYEACQFQMIHDHALVISYEKQPASAHTDMWIYYIISSVASYMFRPTTVAIFRQVYF